jgi:hypothetical protein
MNLRVPRTFIIGGGGARRRARTRAGTRRLLSARTGAANAHPGTREPRRAACSSRSAPCGQGRPERRTRSRGPPRAAGNRPGISAARAIPAKPTMPRRGARPLALRRSERGTACGLCRPGESSCPMIKKRSSASQRTFRGTGVESCTPVQTASASAAFVLPARARLRPVEPESAEIPNGHEDAARAASRRPSRRTTSATPESAAACTSPIAMPRPCGLASLQTRCANAA